MLEKKYEEECSIFAPKSPKNEKPCLIQNNRKVYKRRRGTKRYFCFVQERFSDFYCLLKYEKNFYLLEDNFNFEDLIFTSRDINEVREFLKKKSLAAGKSITFSMNSLKIR